MFKICTALETTVALSVTFFILTGKHQCTFDWRLLHFSYEHSTVYFIHHVRVQMCALWWRAFKLLLFSLDWRDGILECLGGGWPSERFESDTTGFFGNIFIVSLIFYPSFF